LPILMPFALSRQDPDAVDKLCSTALGGAVFLGILVLECLGTLWIRRIVAVEV
jgi:Flp pilus assembly protein TadB